MASRSLFVPCVLVLTAAAAAPTACTVRIVGLEDGGGEGGIGGAEPDAGGAPATGGVDGAAGESSGGAPPAAGPCVDLCTGAGYASGHEMDFGNGLVECLCAGDGEALEQSACTDYCSDFGVSAEESYLTTEVADVIDKCVCDGTSP